MKNDHLLINFDLAFVSTVHMPKSGGGGSCSVIQKFSSILRKNLCALRVESKLFSQKISKHFDFRQKRLPVFSAPLYAKMKINVRENAKKIVFVQTTLVTVTKFMHGTEVTFLVLENVTLSV